MTPAECYRAYPAFAAIVDRVAEERREGAEQILAEMERDLATWTTPPPESTTTAEDLSRELRELRRREIPVAGASDYRPGAREPGHRPDPPVPPWARDRRAPRHRRG